jgi:hypothetical protein
MIKQSWISASTNLYWSLPCRHFKWKPAEVYRGEFNNTLSNPLLLIGSVYVSVLILCRTDIQDPATPLRNARRLAKEMGDNARLSKPEPHMIIEGIAKKPIVVHHGYGHSSARDPSSCTNDRIRAFLLNGTLPEQSEVDCYADSKPFDDGYSSQ